MKADRGQIEQVVMNLAVNARDAMPQGGRLIIETANVELDDEYVRRHMGARPGPHVMLAVSRHRRRHGPREHPGATSSSRSSPPRSRARAPASGLATVYGIVKQSGGHIEVDSEPGQGTTFRIYLPAGRRGGADGRPAPRGRPRPAGGTETILLVEDEEGVRELARDILRASGYTVLEAAQRRRGPRCSASGTRARSTCCSPTWSCRA